MSLDSIVGQERAIGAIREARRADRLHHALLFTGPAGVGKRTTAMALAAETLCRTGDACGRCDACAQIRAGSHPDLTVEGLEEGRSEIRIEQVRNLQTRLSRVAIGGERPVAVVDGADLLSKPGQNAFLKTLEEPPGSALVILVATSSAALLPTIRSRCQRLLFVPLAREAVAAKVLEMRKVDAETADLLARVADGSLGTALALEPEPLREALSKVDRVLEIVAARGSMAVSEAARELLGVRPDDIFAAAPPDREWRNPGLTLLFARLRDRLRDGVGTGELTEPGKRESLQKALEAAEAVKRTRFELIRNANPALAVERLLLDLSRLPGAA